MNSDTEENERAQADHLQTPSRLRPRKSLVTTIYVISDDEDDIDDTNEAKIKPTHLFSEKDVDGKQMFMFKKNKRRNAMASKAACAVTPSKDLQISKLEGTPKKNMVSRILSECAKTPLSVRHKMKKEIVSRVIEIGDSDEDFSDSGSEFNPTEDESSASEISSAEEDQHSSGSDNEVVITKVRNLNIVPIKKKTAYKTRAQKELNYAPQSDNYFSSHASSKVVTSNHTLDKLKNPRLSQDEIQKLLKSLKLTESHKTALNDLFEEIKKQFPKWLLVLNEGFNIMLYGLGSKRNILTEFYNCELMNEDVVIVNGFFPSLTIKDILDSILEILELTISSSNTHEIVDFVEAHLKQKKYGHLYLIVHNIDGPMLRNNKSQNVLARLAKLDKIHLLASIDHLNAPLLWDHMKLSSFNYCWFDATSFIPYSYETSFEGSLLVNNSGALALSSLKNVFESLTSNSRGIYLMIAKHQLDNKDNQHYQGIAFKDLYGSCREAFLVSSVLALRAQLTEFLDHKLIKMKRTADGIEHLIIPIENSLLQQFLDQQNK